MQVFSNLSPQDIKSTRLACRGFCDLSSSFLFKRVYFALRPGTMDVLFQIARHPVFSQSVTELNYDITEIKELLPDDGMDKCEEGLDRRDGYAEMYKVYAAQEASKESGDDLACLKFAFSRMPRIRTVRCLGWRKIVQLLLDEDGPKPFAYLHVRNNRFVSHEGFGEDMRAATAECWYTSKGPMIWDRLDPCLLASNEAIRITTSGTSTQLDTVLRAAYETKATISSFSSENFTRIGHQDGNFLRTAALDETPTRLEAFGRLFGNLRHFSADLYNDPILEEPLAANLVGELLSTAPYLETLNLYNIMGPPCHISMTLRTCHWPRIRSIQLVGMRLRAKVLEIFLQRNAASLKEVDIGLVRVPDDNRRGKIADILTEHLNLDGVRLGCQFVLLEQLNIWSSGMEKSAVVRTMEARVLHGRPNSLRPQPQRTAYYHC